MLLGIVTIDAMSRLSANLDMFQQLSNDEWGNETKGIGLAELLRPIDERVLKVNFNLYKDYSDRHVFREVNAPK